MLDARRFGDEPLPLHLRKGFGAPCAVGHDAVKLAPGHVAHQPPVQRQPLHQHAGPGHARRVPLRLFPLPQQRLRLFLKQRHRHVLRGRAHDEPEALGAKRLRGLEQLCACLRILHLLGDVRARATGNEHQSLSREVDARGQPQPLALGLLPGRPLNDEHVAAFGRRVAQLVQRKKAVPVQTDVHKRRADRRSDLLDPSIKQTFGRFCGTNLLAVKLTEHAVLHDRCANPVRRAVK